MKQRFSGLRFVVYLVGFTGLLWLRLLISPDGKSGVLAFFACVASLAAAYLVYYAASEGYFRNLAGGVVVYLAIAAVVVACPPFVLLLAFWSVTSLFKQRRALLMHALASVTLFLLIFPMPLAERLGMPELAGAPAGLAYLVFSLAWSAVAARSPLKIGLFKFATMLVALPLIGTFVSLVGGGMLNRPERRVRNSLARSRRAMQLALPAPDATAASSASRVASTDAGLALPAALIAGIAAEVLMPVAVAAE
ncbi:hypothetical protein [Caballeronia sp. HLA56]